MSHDWSDLGIFLYVPPNVYLCVVIYINLLILMFNEIRIFRDIIKKHAHPVFFWWYIFMLVKQMWLESLRLSAFSCIFILCLCVCVCVCFHGDFAVFQLIACLHSWVRGKKGMFPPKFAREVKWNTPLKMCSSDDILFSFKRKKKKSVFKPLKTSPTQSSWNKSWQDAW